MSPRAARWPWLAPLSALLLMASGCAGDDDESRARTPDASAGSGARDGSVDASGDAGAGGSSGADSGSPDGEAGDSGSPDGEAGDSGTSDSGTDAGLSGAISVELDPSLSPAPAMLLDADADQPRPLAALTDRSSIPVRFIENEVIVATSDHAARDALAQRLHATVTRSFVPATFKIAGAPEQHLLRVDTSALEGALDAASLATELARLNPRKRGELRISSSRGLRLLAALAHEAAAGAPVSVNFVLAGTTIAQGSTTEGSNATTQTVGGLAYSSNPWNWTYLQAGGPQAIGVTTAWQDLQKIGALNAKLKIAVLDGGFKNSGDFPANTEHHTNSVHDVSPTIANENRCTNDAICNWHGTNVVDTLMGTVDNAAAAAGPAGPIADAVTIRVSGDLFNYLGAYGLALASDARIVNMSMSGRIPALLTFSLEPLNAFTKLMEKAGVTFVASAGNDDADIDSEDCFLGFCYEDAWFVPCENDGVLCVGALADGQKTKHAASNWGHEDVDMFGPGLVWVGPNDDAPQIHTFGATSAASPFVAGVAALLKAGSPGLTPADIRKILIDTGNPSPDDKVKTYVKASAAVNQSAGPGMNSARFRSIKSGRGDDPCTWDVNSKKGIPSSTDDVIVTTTTVVDGVAGGTVKIEEGGSATSVSTTGDLIIGSSLTIGTSAVSLGSAIVGGNLYVHTPLQVTGSLSLGGGLWNYSRIQLPNGPGGIRFGDFGAKPFPLPAIIDNNGEIRGPASGTLPDVTLGPKTRSVNLYQLMGSGAWPGVHGFSVSNGAILQLFADASLSVQSFGVDVGGVLDLNGKTLELRGENVFNAGTIRATAESSTLLVVGRAGTHGKFENYGAITGDGEVQLAPASTDFLLINAGEPKPAWTTRLRIAAGTVTAELELGAPVVVDPSGTLSLRGGVWTLSNELTVAGKLASSPGSTLCFNGPRLTNEGTVSVEAIGFGCPGSGVVQQVIAGHGSFTGSNWSVGGAGGQQTTLKLAGDTLAFITNKLQVNRGSRLELDGHTLHFTGASFFNDGSVAGPGTVRVLRASGAATFSSNPNPPASFSATLAVDSGQLIASDTTFPLLLDAPLKIAAGAALSIGPSGLSTSSDVSNAGTIAAAPGGTNTFSFRGAKFVNDGTISGARVSFGRLGTPLQHWLSGAGTWSGPGGQLEIASSSIVNLASDVTYGDSKLFLDGIIDAGVFSLSLPCGLLWTGTGDIFGTSRRTNAASCAPDIQVGNAQSSIRFTSGPAPSTVAVSLVRGAPADFPSAVKRQYVVTAEGAAGWTATLRLAYREAELNGNDEAALHAFELISGVWSDRNASARDSANDWLEVAAVTSASRWVLASGHP